MAEDAAAATEAVDAAEAADAEAARERRVSTRRTLGSAGRWMCRRWCLRFEE